MLREGVLLAEVPEMEEVELDATEETFAEKRSHDAGDAEAGFDRVGGLHFEVVAQRGLSAKTQGI